MAQEIADSLELAGDSFKKVLNSYSAFVTYVPLRTEIPFSDFITLPKTDLIYQIMPRVALDPFGEAEKATKVAEGKKTAVFMPGRQFDASGTRFGQGGGWYDRFLSKVPAAWMRVGFCFARQFSAEILKREDWDQVMDFVCVVDEKTGTLSVHETHARQI